MKVEEAIRSVLIANTPVAALIGTRIYPLIIPQAIARPAIAYQRISGGPQRAHSGFSALSRTRIQLTLEAASYSAVKSLAAACRAAMESYRGRVVSGGDSLTIYSIFVENETDGYSENAGVGSDQVPIVRIDLNVSHNET